MSERGGVDVRRLDKPTREDFKQLASVVDECAAALDHAELPDMGDAPYLLTKIAYEMVSEFERDLRSDLRDLIELTHLLQSDLTNPLVIPRWRLKDISRAFGRLAGPSQYGTVEEVRTGGRSVLEFARWVRAEFHDAGWIAGQAVVDGIASSAEALLESLPESSSASRFDSEYFPDSWDKSCDLLAAMGERRLFGEIEPPDPLPASRDALRDSADRKASSAEETKRSSGRSNPRCPRPQDWYAWHLCTMLGLTQADAAQRVQESTRSRCDQSQVSRSVKRVREYLEDGNEMPASTQTVLRSLDPKLLDMGKRQDPRDPRPSDTAGQD